MSEQTAVFTPVEIAISGVVLEAMHSARFCGDFYSPEGSERAVFRSEVESMNPRATVKRFVDNLVQRLSSNFDGHNVVLVPQSVDSLRQAEYFFAMDSEIHQGFLPIRVILVNQPDCIIIELGGKHRIETI